MRDQSHFGDNELQAAITVWVAGQLLIGNLRRVEAWLPRAAFRRYPLQAIRGDGNVHEAASLDLGSVKLAKKPPIPVSELKSIELHALHLAGHQRYPAAEYKQVRLQSLSDLRDKVAKTQVAANFADLVSVYSGSLVTTACLRRWHEHGFGCWSELLYHVVQYATGQRYWSVVLYLLFQGARPNYVADGVSMCARAYDWVKREASIENVRIFLLLTALDESLYQQDHSVLQASPLSACWQDRAVLSDQVVPALQRLMLYAFDAKRKKQSLCSRPEYQKLTRLVEKQAAFSLAEVKKSLSLLLKSAGQHPYFHRAADARLCRQVSIDKSESAVALLQGCGVSPHSILSYEKELSEHQLQQALVKDRLQFQLSMVVRISS